MLGARAAYVGKALDLAPHQNVTATVAIALRTPFELQTLSRTGESSACSSLSIALIPPCTLHHLQATGDMAFVYLDALCDDWAQIQQVDLWQARARLLGLGPDAIGTLDIQQICQALGLPLRAPGDPRMVRVIRELDMAPQRYPKVEDAARQVSLSASRFQSLFRQQVGMPFRRYRLWRRMAVIIRSMARGHSLTEAALDAGFSSSAHLSASFKAMFGLPLSSLLSSGVHIQLLD